MLPAITKEKALRLRLKGLSYNEINRALGVPKSTLRSWMGEVVLSDNARARLAQRVKDGTLRGLVKRNKLQTHLAWQRAKVMQTKGRSDIGNSFTAREVALIGVALYWAEGYKRLKVRAGKHIPSHTIQLVNADPGMIRAFIHFLKVIYKIPDRKITLAMRLYDHINEQEAMTFWQRITGLPKECFRRSTYLVSISSKRKRPFNRLPYGSLQVEVADTKKFHHIIGSIEGMKENFQYDMLSTPPR
jgi:hypothetical protein